VHTDTQAAESARAVNAKAYTLGHDVVFGAEQYAPGTSKGRRLMAHELTHVVQQAIGRVQAKKNRGREDSEFDQINKLLLKNASLPTHIKRTPNHQQPISVNKIPEVAGNTTIRRWSGHEHKAFGDLAGRMAADRALWNMG